MKKFCEKLCCKSYWIIFILLLSSSGIVSQTIEKKYPPNSFEIIPALNFKNTDLRDVLRAIAFDNQTNIVVDNSIDKKISVALFNIGLRDAVQIIAEDNNLLFSHDSIRFCVKKPIPKPKAPPPEEARAIVNYYDESNEADFFMNNVSLKNLVEVLRTETGKNFLITGRTAGKITGTLYRIDFFTGLKNILLNNGFYPQLKDSIYYIARSTFFTSLNEKNSSQSAYWVNAQSNVVSIDVNEASLKNVINDITNQLNLQVIKLAEPEGVLSVRCSNLKVDKALDYLLKGTEFTYKNEEGIYIFGKIDDRSLDKVELVKLFHLRADKIKDKLPQNLFKNVNAGVSIEHNAFILNGPNEEINALKEYLTTLDKPVPQVMIEALVVDYNLDNLYQFGLTAGTGDSTAAKRPDKWFPGFDVTASGNKINSILQGIGEIEAFGTKLNIGKMAKLPDDFYANIKMLETNGIANVKSRPILSTLNGHTASLKIGTVQHYVFSEILPVTNQLSSTFIERETIQKIEANISFEITPWVGPNNQLTLEIKPDFQTPVGQFSPDKRVIPAINTRTLESTVKLRDGETIILGGLIQETESTTESKVPLLGDIPLLGKLFTSTQKQKNKGELIIYITPRIFYEDEFGYAYYDYAD